MIELPSPCLVVLVGAAGSGKSTWAGEHFPGHVVSSDSLRALAGEGEHDLRASVDAFALLDEVVERRMRRRLTTVIDTLGTDAERRRHWCRIAAEHGVPCHAVVLATPPATIRKWNKGRPKRVPDAVLRSQLAELEAVAEAVRGETFDGVHEITPEVVPMLVAPSLARPARDVTGAVDVTPNARSRSGSRCRSSRGRAARPRSARTCATSPVAPRPRASTPCT